MSTDIKPEVSKRNKYHISKHKYYELKHYCLQYPEWEKMYRKLNSDAYSSAKLQEYAAQDRSFCDPVGTVATLRAYYAQKINELKAIAKQADPELADYILMSVTTICSYPYMKTVMNIPCSKDTFYDRYRKFFFLLARARK